VPRVADIMTWGVKRSVFAALPYSVQARTLLAVLTGGDPQAVIAPALTERLGLTALYRLLLDHVRVHAAAPYPYPDHSAARASSEIAEMRVQPAVRRPAPRLAPGRSGRRLRQRQRPPCCERGSRPRGRFARRRL